MPASARPCTRHRRAVAGRDRVLAPQLLVGEGTRPRSCSEVASRTGDAARPLVVRLRDDLQGDDSQVRRNDAPNQGNQ